MISKELFDEILELNRPETINVKEYGNYSDRERVYVYDDRNKTYFACQSKRIDTTVNSTKALVGFIKEEFKRQNKKTGKLSTLKINIDGGSFRADDDFDTGKCEYHRITSEQWDRLSEINGSIINHESFLMALLKLSPSIVDFKKVYAKFLKVRIIGKSELVSNPVFVNNEAESGYLVKYKLDGGQGADDVVPNMFQVSVPYAKGSKQKYTVDVDVQIMNDGCNQLRIKLNIPLLENVEEQAIIDEIEDLKEQLSEYSDMLVLSDI